VHSHVLSVKVLNEICIFISFFYKMLFILEYVSGFTFILQRFLYYCVLGLRSEVIKVKHFSWPRFVGVYIVETSTSYWYVFKSQL
jgi:hypothetical protein